MAASTLFFVHIPKAAGSTMLRILDRQYRNRSVYDFRSSDIAGSIEGVRRMSPSERSSISLVKGHCILAAAPMFDNDVRYITFLRDPFDQFVSSFYYVRRAAWNRTHERVKKMKDLREYLDFRVTMKLDNTQVRHLSGDIDAMWTPKTDAPLSKQIDKEVFSKAKRWLDAMSYVGVTSAFDHSLLMMRNGLGWQRHCYYQVQNRTLNRPRIAEHQDLERSFRDAYAWDLELYALGKKRFDSDLEQQGSGFEQEVIRFRYRNQLLQGLNRLFHFL